MLTLELLKILIRPCHTISDHFDKFRKWSLSFNNKWILENKIDYVLESI